MLSSWVDAIVAVDDQSGVVVVKSQNAIIFQQQKENEWNWIRHHTNW